MLYRVRVWFGTRQCYSYLSDWFNYDCLVFNKLRPRQNGCNFSDDISNCIFWNENGWISITISLKFVPKGPIDNIPPLIRIMAWCWPGDKPLSEPMMDNLLTHICVSRTQWVKVILVMNHDDVIKWKHIPRCWSFVGRINQLVARRFVVFFDLRLSKQSSYRWFEKPWRSLWRYCNV